MKFSMIFEAQLANPTREREHQLLADCVEQSVYAEEMGFDRVWAVEHHALKYYAHMSAPEIFLTWVAARTSRIRIGHGVVCMPFGYNHPVRVGERVAMLDALSGGRLDVGGGRGATLQEMSLVGVDPADTYPQMEETFRMLGHMWEKDEFEWHGLLDIDPHPILPRPVQDPHPPFYLACTKRETVELAAELGVGSLVMGFAGPHEVAELRKMYDDAIARRTGDRFVSSVVNNHFSALCPTIVLDDEQDAVRVGARGQRFFAEAIAHWYGGGPLPTEAEIEGDPNSALEEARDRYIAHLHDAAIPVGPHSADTFELEQAYGDANTAIEHTEKLRDAGADEIMCLIQMGTVPHEACMETIRHWGETVIPYFRDLDQDDEED
jgi:alkanesulfonate monooxygenase SsuD/methylene tetrahydromethanopterin reductase-like flavin-dependent oxidoreductase (luciferase family)